MILTKETLERIGACKRAKECLEDHFGGKLEVNETNVRKWLALSTFNVDPSCPDYGHITSGIDDAITFIWLCCGASEVGRGPRPNHWLARRLGRYLNRRAPRKDGIWKDRYAWADRLCEKVFEVAKDKKRLVNCVVQCVAMLDARGEGLR